MAVSNNCDREVCMVKGLVSAPKVKPSVAYLMACAIVTQ